MYSAFLSGQNLPLTIEAVLNGTKLFKNAQSYLKMRTHYMLNIAWVENKYMNLL